MLFSYLSLHLMLAVVPVVVLTGDWETLHFVHSGVGVCGQKPG